MQQNFYGISPAGTNKFNLEYVYEMRDPEDSYYRIDGKNFYNKDELDKYLTEFISEGKSFVSKETSWKKKIVITEKEDNVYVELKYTSNTGRELNIRELSSSKDKREFIIKALDKLEALHELLLFEKEECVKSIFKTN